MSGSYLFPTAIGVMTLFNHPTLKNNRYRLALVLAVNLLPLIGILFFCWSVFEIAILYWFETLLIGFSEIIRNLCRGPKREILKPVNQAIQRASHPLLRGFHQIRKVIIIVISSIVSFLVTSLIYGLCAAMYGMAIVMFLSDIQFEVPQWAAEQPIAGGIVGIVNFLFSSDLKWAAIALTLPALWRLFSDGFARLTQDSPEEKTEEEASHFLVRIVFLHLAIAAGAFVVHLFGSPVPLVVLLLLGKTAMEGLFVTLAPGETLENTEA